MQSASELSALLADRAEAVCRHYLSSGHPAGNYWIVGDLSNAAGRSLYVHLKGNRKGRWRDAATGEHGDLLDLISQTCHLDSFRAVAYEARRFLALPDPEPRTRAATAVERPGATRPADERARRLFAMSAPIDGTLAEAYLRSRGILQPRRYSALRFHPSCYYRHLVTGETQALPALIAAVTDRVGTVTGVHRTWLDPGGAGKAQVDEPRRSLGFLLGNAVRFGVPHESGVPVAVAGEGIESMLSLAQVMPRLPAAAALSAGHLGAFLFPPHCARLYIAADADASGRHGIEALSRRAADAGVLPLVLRSELGDFNEDLRRLGPARLAAWLADQLAPEDRGLLLSMR